MGAGGVATDCGVAASCASWQRSIATGGRQTGWPVSLGCRCEAPGIWRSVDRFHGIATRLAWGMVCGLIGGIVVLVTGQLLAGYAVLVVCVLVAAHLGARSGWF